MDGFTYRGTSDGLRRRFEELRRLDVREFPNAAYDLLRTILECSIKDYFVTKGQPLPPGKMLGFCIDQLAADFQGDQRMTYADQRHQPQGKDVCESVLRYGNSTQLQQP